MQFSRGDKIDGYTVAFPINNGKYAETYRVQGSKGENYFLKLIDLSRLTPSGVGDDGVPVEVSLLRKIKSPYVPAFVSSGFLTTNGKKYCFVVTEFVPGETLEEKIAREGSLTVFESKSIILGILNALDYLGSFEDPIIHNEISPLNVLLEEKDDGTLAPKLIDFGHALPLSSLGVKPDLTEINVSYLAPERFSGYSTPLSDIYAVGALLYTLVFDRPPFVIPVEPVSGDQLEEVYRRIMEEPIRIPDIERFELDDRLRSCIQKALEKEPEDRFANARDFIDALSGEAEIPVKKVAYSSGKVSKKVIGEKLPEKDAGGFSAVAGMEELKKAMQEEVIEPLRNPELYKTYGVSIPNGMLLYGPPGCGKTFFAKHFAAEVGFNFMLFTPAMLKSKYVNASQENIA